MKFKLGDKVKIITDESKTDKYIGLIGKIIETDRIAKEKSVLWDYKCMFDDGSTSVFSLREIKRLPNKGEQLLLFEL